MQPVMTEAELRYWLALLHREHGWPWKLLGRTLRLGSGDHVASKVRGNSWFRGGEQRRSSAQIDRIISGELVPVRIGRRVHGRWYHRWEAVLADHPVPLQSKPRMRYTLGQGLHWHAPRVGVDPVLPSFAKVLAPWVG